MPTTTQEPVESATYTCPVCRRKFVPSREQRRYRRTSRAGRSFCSSACSGANAGKAPRRPRPITKVQLSILRFIGETIAARLRPPTIREIGTRFGISSPNGVASHLKALRRKGFVSIVRRKDRVTGQVSATIEIAGLAEAVGPLVTAHVAALIEESRP